MALSSQKMVIKIGSVEIEGLNSIGIPGITKEENDVTTHGSNGYRENMEGLADCGEVSLEGFIDPTDAGQEALVAASAPGAEQENFTITDPSNKISWAFTGWVKSYTPNAGAVGGVLGFSASIRVSGAFTRTVTGA